ncbi:YhgE/Pip domain-containing protein [Actinoplanes friuliensis]|uniref:ABC transporter permease n=1 Tax=Actinoplanes friuliensis DSM 7358 TaxID=1246995 RepID=U5W8K8_9ACTN|nr:YhgE/Pip domain-containing protein [Actinoplanes friuliensis]AGZ45479.1 ABC transporter permease [Actinoplanes friuliensis DSM 7358]
MTGLSSFRLAGFELRRFLRGRLPVAALVVLAVIPLLYGALYLYAFWDPYGRLNHIPAALVVEDVAATASDGTKVDAGHDLADELIKREVFDWHVTDERGAEAGLADGSYQLSLRIPKDFSTDLTTGPDANATPKSAQLVVINDDATNYLSGVFSRTAFQEVQAAAAQTAQAGYFDKMLIGFTDLKSQTQEAADGATKIDNGLTDANQGAGELEDGLTDADRGAGKLSGGLGTAAQGADDLASGLATLQSGAAQLATGTQQAAAGGKQLATTVDAAADRIGPVLRDNAELIEDAANQVADGADLLARNVGRLSSAADDAVEQAEDLQAYLNGLPDETEGIDQARAAAKELVTAAKRVQSTIRAADLDALSDQLHEVAATAHKVARAAPHLADDVAAARRNVDDLAAGLGDLATGAKQLNSGAADAVAGATDLRGGIYQLASGARSLDNGLDRLTTGGQQLADGLGDLQSGAAKLSSGLSDGAKQIPGYGDDPQARADLLSDPVALDRTVRHPAATYGVGFAPYFLALALWVGAMITFMVLRPLNRRYVVSGAPAYRVTLAGLLPAVAIGLAQATLLFVVVVFGLGLGPVNPVVTLGLLMLTATAFAAIMQLLGAALGPAGRIVALALLMLQLTSSGGTYPVQTTPGFFQVIHPLLPMTYVVDVLRHAIDGGPAGTVVTGMLALLGYGLGALALTVAVARGKRRLTPSDLHPELVI